ncbi:TonB-dependent receptor plug domain-containing protein [Pectinatus sottacetonis]|uniref:TonB-dependent receptor plug domain-containing protein n=1 Tax=Pectinatus sottacetonis TaxID=1002795 RepID=UPI0018C45D05|nr:TonB-dependent receptor [Pectinatus sottacetonis]
MKKYLLTILVILLVNNIGYCMAKNTDVSEKDLSAFSLEETIVTATKTPINKKILPTDVSVITAEDISRRNARTLQDIIDSLPGIAISRNDGKQTLNIRGFSSRYSMILIDGRRIPAEPDFDYELARLPLDNISRIEIVRGSAAAMYGADALGGVINLVTKKGKKKKLKLEINELLDNTTAHSSHDYSVSYGSGLKGKTEFYISANHVKKNLLAKENGTSFFPFGTRNNFNARINYHSAKDETFSLYTSYMRENNHEYGIFNGLKNYKIFTDLHNKNNRQQYSLSYEKKQKLCDTYINIYNSIWNKTNDTLNRRTGQYTNAIYGRTTLTGIEARSSRNISNKHRFTWGSDYRSELFKGTGIQTGENEFSKILRGKLYSGSAVRTNYTGVFLQDEWKMAPDWFMVSSFRLDDSNRFKANLSPKLGLTYAPRADLRYKLNIGTGFRVPSPNQLFLNLNIVKNGNLVNLAGNADLTPEKSMFYDISVEKDWKHANGKVTFFSSRVKDMIDQVWISSNQLQYQNIDRVKIQGIESSLYRPIGRNLDWNINYTYLNAINSDTNEKLYDRARHKISSQWTFHPVQNWRIAIWMDEYIGYYCQPDANTSTQKNYMIWNINCEKDLTKNQSINVAVKNIFNHKDDILSIPGIMVEMGYKIKL